MKKILIVFFLVISIFFGYSQTVSAQTIQPTPTPAYDMPDTNPDVQQNLSTYTQSVLIDLMGAFSCQLVGINPADVQGRCLGTDPKTGKLGYVNQGYGVVGFLTNSMAMTFNMPIHTSDYTKDMAANFGIAKKAYAQGIGFSSISPLINIWKVFLNTVYLLFVIIFMLIGLGIIFRRNIDARSVMTIQNALPRVIVVLVLVTFSFAISGFLIDIMYVVMYFVYELFKQIPGVQIDYLNPTSLQGSTPFHAVGGVDSWFHLVGGASSDLGGILGDVFNGAGRWGRAITTLVLGIITVIAGFATGGVGFLVGGLGVLTTATGLGGGGKIIATAGTFIAFLIITIALLIALFRLWFQLIKAYIFILIDIVLAPFWIAGSLIPGSPLTAGGWFRHLLSYLAVFPATLLMFLLGNVFVQAFTVHHGNQMFVPPMVGGNLNPQHFGALIGLAIIFVTPEVINMTKSIFKSPNVGTYQKAITGGFGAGAAVVQTPIKKAQESLFKHDQFGPAGPGAMLKDYAKARITHAKPIAAITKRFNISGRAEDENDQSIFAQAGRMWQNTNKWNRARRMYNRGVIDEKPDFNEVVGNGNLRQDAAGNLDVDNMDEGLLQQIHQDLLDLKNNPEYRSHYDSSVNESAQRLKANFDITNKSIDAMPMDLNDAREQVIKTQGTDIMRETINRFKETHPDQFRGIAHASLKKVGASGTSSSDTAKKQATSPTNGQGEHSNES